MKKPWVCRLIVVLLGAALCAAGNPASQPATAPASPPELEDLLRAAGTCYSFGIDQHGSRPIFDRGLKKLLLAEDLVKSAERVGSLASGQASEARRRIAAMRADLQGQKDISDRWFGSVFPLSRMIEPAFGGERENARSLLSDPDYVAVGKAAESLIENLLQPGERRAQQHVVVTAAPYRQALCSKVNYVFEQSGKFVVHSFSEISEAISEADMERFRQGEVTPELAQELCKAYKSPCLIVAKITETDSSDGISFYTVEAMAHEPGKPPVLVGTGYGFCRDGRAMLLPIMLANMIMLLAAVGMIVAMARGTSVRPAWGAVMGIAGSGFVIGRILPWALAPLLLEIAPAPELPAESACWWPCLFALALYLVPIIVIWAIQGRLTNWFSVLRTRGLEGQTEIASTLGASAYLAGPLLLHLGIGGLGVLVPLMLAAAAAGAVLVGAIGILVQVRRILLAALMLIVLGLAAFHLSATGLWLLAGAGAAGLWWAWSLGRTSAVERPEEQSRPGNAEELLRRVRDHEYIPSPSFDQAWLKAKPVLQGQAVMLGLAGPAGAGTTTMAEVIIRKLQDAPPQDRRSGAAVRIFRGECAIRGEASSRTAEASDSYAPYLQALSETSVPAILSPSGAGEAFAEAVGQILEDVVPFGWLVFGKGGSVPPEAVTRPERFRLCAQLLRKLAARETIVLFIDNADAMDVASGELTRYLLREFADDGVPGLLILLAGHDADALHTLGLPAERVVDVVPLDRPAQERLLLASIGLSSNAARAVLRHAEDVHRDDTAWLLETVATAAMAGALVRKADGKCHLTNDRSDSLPVPKDLKEAVETKLKGLHRDERRIIVLAACMGREFSISALAGCLDMPAHELSHVLSDMEADTGLLVDEEKNDDNFAFRSQFVYDSVCRCLRVQPQGPAYRSPVIVRQSYAQLAQLSEQTLGQQEDRLASVATLFYAAGRTHAARGREYCLKVADTRARHLLFSDAIRFLNMAKECADACRQPIEDYDARLLCLRCDAANLAGVDVQRTARDALALADAHPDTPPELLFKAARACHDACLPEATLRLARRLSEKATGPALRAAGLHLAGLALGRLGDGTAEMDHLRGAVDLLESIPQEQCKPEEKAALAQALNSLAEQILEDAPSEQKPECKSLLLRSLQLKQELGDRGGQAMTYGCLGRYAREVEGDIPAARRYFWKNYRICIEVGNHDWQAMQLIRIGDCICQRSCRRARLFYEAALALARTGSHGRNTAAALVGLVRCCTLLGDTGATANYAQELIEVAARAPDTLAPEALASLREFLRGSAASPTNGWLERLRDLASEPRFVSQGLWGNNSTPLSSPSPTGRGPG